MIACQRCTRPLHHAPLPETGARLLRRAQTPDGLCATCAVRAWLATSPLARQLTETGPQAMLLPHVQAGFGRLMQAGLAEMAPAEIDWERLVAEWDLPLPPATRRSR